MLAESLPRSGNITSPGSPKPSLNYPLGTTLPNFPFAILTSNEIDAFAYFCFSLNGIILYVLCCVLLVLNAVSVKFIHVFAGSCNLLVLLLYKILFMNLPQCIHSTTDGIWVVSR